MPFCRCLCTGTRTDSHVCSHVLLCLFTGRCHCVCAGVSPARFTKLFEMLGEHRHLLKIKDLKHFEERIKKKKPKAYFFFKTPYVLLMCNGKIPNICIFLS